MIRYGKSKWSTLITVYFIIGWPYIDMSIEILGYWMDFCIDRTGAHEALGTQREETPKQTK